MHIMFPINHLSLAIRQMNCTESCFKRKVFILSLEKSFTLPVSYPRSTTSITRVSRSLPAAEHGHGIERHLSLKIISFLSNLTIHLIT